MFRQIEGNGQKLSNSVATTNIVIANNANNQQLCGLKTSTRCRGSVVACPALQMLFS